tara:strand:- start:803 stop:1642 length:840 start_codon:yes stop_codon:yes gene_type:complete
MSVNTESSLTNPKDRDTKNKWKPDTLSDPLTREQTIEAAKELNITSFVEKFPRIDRTYADPPVNLQNYGLISFIPAKGSTPNEDGIYGFAKLRGNFNSEMESSQRAETIIKTVDSFHKIYTTYVGRPFPLTESSAYSAENTEVDIRNSTTKSMSSDIKRKKKEEQQTINEIKIREKELLEDTSKDKEDDPTELYTTLRVKKAQLSWTYLEHMKKMKEVKQIIIKTRKEITELESNEPKYREEYFQKYLDARENSGLPVDRVTQDTSFMKFLVEDAELGF